MSRASGSELEKRLLDIPLAKIRKIVDQIAQAAIFLRSNGLCHRDIKSANIYISDDFDHCTLLDISVVREVTDPVGVGTDHDGQLPIVATARYSPPEYLFRLFEPSPELWHALTIYQLGALLHDLIMREPLFQAEYAKSTENRYRFAWIIATIDPVLSNDRIDRDLILTARRALDKNWQTRSSLRLEDFLAISDVEQEHSLQVLGLGIPAIQPAQPDPFADQLKRVREVAEELEIRVVQYLRDKGVRAVHDLQPGDTDVCKKISFRWNAMAGIGEPQGAAVCFQLSLRHISKQHGSYLEVMAKLEMIVNNKPTTVTLPLPEVRDEVGIESMLYEHAIEAFQRLAVEVIRVNVEAVEA